MSAKYTAIISRDLQKKRKKWIDGEITIDNITKVVKVFELSDLGDKIGRQVYSGIVEDKLLSKLIETEEVKLGSLLVCISDLIVSIDSNVFSTKEISAESVTVAPTVILRRPKALPFKSPRGFNGQLVSSKSSVVNGCKSANSPAFGRQIDPVDVVVKAPVETIVPAAPLRAGCLSSMSTFSCPSSRTLECRSDSTAVSSVQSTTPQLFSLKKLYDLPHRICQVNHIFRSPQQYAEQFSAATVEEIQLSLASVMSNLESRTLNALGINSTIAGPSSSKVSTISNGATNRIVPQLPRKPLVSKSSSPPSVEAVVAKVRSVGIPLMNRVDVIVSPVRDEESSYKAGPKKWSKGLNDSDDDEQFGRAGKRCKTDGENEQSANHEGRSSQGMDAATNDGTKLYFKVSDGKHRSCPQGAESYGKGDIWVLWRVESRVSTAAEVFTAVNSTLSSLKGSATHTAAHTQSSLEQCRRSFITLRSESGYPLPWLKGALWQDVWVVRSLWHGVSDAGMMEFANVDNSKNVPSGMGKFPVGRKRGALEGSYSAIRMSHEMTSLLSLDLLHGGVTVTRAKVSVPADILTHELLFPDLLRTPIFRTFLQPPGLHSSSAAEHPGLRSQPVLKGLKPHVGEDILAFPTASRAAREEGVRRTVAEFGLNADQEAVLTLVSSWFTPRDEMCHEESTDIILVEGVFGSGKSHLLASVCVLIKRLSIISAATMSSLDSQHQPGNLLGVKRSLSGGGGAHPARPCSAVKCLLSANTNVAVDRVMVQLANRTISISTTSSADDALADDGDDASIWDNRIEEKQEHTDSSPVIARVGCVAKIDRSLRKHFVLQAESKANALRELVRLSKIDSDPQLLKMADDTRKTDFSFIQTKMIQDADVIGVTCASAANVLLKGIRCHVLILDEASQMTEPLSLLPLACVRPLRLLLVGDSKQLPPALATSGTSMQEAISNSNSNPSNVSTALSANSPDRGNEMDTIRVKKRISTTLTRTLFDRLQETGWPCITLRTQYRCHPAIAQICSELFYEGQLLHGVTPQDRPCLVPRLPPIAAVDSTGEDQRRGDSCVNQTEAMIARDLVIWLKSRCSHPSELSESPRVRGVSIGVICLYKAQACLVTKMLADAGYAVGVNDPGSVSMGSDRVAHSGTVDRRQSAEAFDYNESAEDEQLREMGDQSDDNNRSGACSSGGRSRKEGGSDSTLSMNELRVSTVDAFQGSEMDVIIICISKKSASSFLSNAARVNVALSRARHHLLILGNGAMLVQLPLWSRVIADARLKVGTLQDLKRVLS